MALAYTPFKIFHYPDTIYSMYSETGIPVKMTMYEEGKIKIEMQLESYHISAWESQPLEEDNSLIGDLPSLSFILSIFSIALIAIVRRVRTN